MTEKLNKNLKDAFSLMLFLSDQQLSDKELLGNVENIISKKNWFNKYSWTEKTQSNYRDWLINHLKRNWRGISKKKPFGKKAREKIADEFIKRYGIKRRNLQISDFVPLITHGQIKEVMSEREFNEFTNFMYGKEVNKYGVYESSLKKFINLLI